MSRPTVEELRDILDDFEEAIRKMSAEDTRDDVALELCMKRVSFAGAYTGDAVRYKRELVEMFRRALEPTE